jgi:hypothetical protein
MSGRVFRAETDYAPVRDHRARLPGAGTRVPGVYMPSLVLKGYLTYFGQYLQEAVARLPQTSEYLARALIELMA